MKNIILTSVKVFKELKMSAKISLGVLVFVIFAFGMIEFTGTPGFCNSCHIMNPFYDSWKASGHSNVDCLKCHLKPGLMNYAAGKFKGFAQSVDCLVGRVGTKPSATVDEISCLRSGCHSTDELESKTVDYGKVKFEHKGHIAGVVGGINISCTTCHGNYEGNEHFRVDKKVCFTCHFLKGVESEDKLVKVGCTGCHQIPDKIIERGLVKVNHAEFISYQASCEDSCHKKQVEKESEVAESICLNCHTFKKEADIDYEELHQMHSTGEKVECFACHGQVVHSLNESSSVSAMMDCKSCHSDTHNIQRNIYMASEHPSEKESSRILGPMFLTHVECTGCHIEQGEVEFGTIDSSGKVAKAVPRACDNCHEPGMGQKYIPFWQKNIKKLYAQADQVVSELEKRYEVEGEKDLQERSGRARAILNSVFSDGSWGVHNFKYTEAMLVRAKNIASE